MKNVLIYVTGVLLVVALYLLLRVVLHIAKIDAYDPAMTDGIDKDRS